MDERPWFKVQEAADYVGVSKDTIYAACARNQLRHIRLGGRRSIRLRTEWLDAWMERHARGETESVDMSVSSLA
jgi:excisionase family DNA binding protein